MFAYAAFGQKDVSVDTKAQTARDVSGKMFQAENLYYHEASQPVPAEVIPSPASTPPNLPVLELSFAVALVRIDDMCPQFGEGGQQSIVVRVRNKPGALGEVGQHARDIFAQLDFDCAIGQSTVERAYWVGRDSNQITLTSGDEAWVFIGIPERGLLSSWHNANTYSRRTREWHSPTYEPEGRSIPWSRGELRGQIYIISHNPRGNKTLAHKQFIFTREDWTNDFGKINLKFIE
jgi:hypothetical protein